MHARSILIVLMLAAAYCSVCSAQHKYRYKVHYRPSNVNSANGLRTRLFHDSASYQRDEPSRTIRTDDQVIAVEEESYVPVSFNIDDGGPSNHGLFNGHAIEMMAPVEVPEYGWNEESKGLSELGQENPGAPIEIRHHADQQPQELTGRSGGLVQCGERQIDPRHAVCCNGLVYRKTSEEDSGKCCGSVAYDDRYFTCCQGRAIVRKNGQLPLCCGDYSRDTLPDQCRHGYQNDTTGLGSTCCRSATGAWKCCIRGESCCSSSAQDRSSAIDVPGFRPACCHLKNEDLTSQCCATTYEKVRVLPDCCSAEKLRPICCQKPGSNTIRCCPGTIGYCCGTDEVVARSTELPRPPPELLYTTRSPIHPPPATFPPRPSYTDRPTRYPVPTYGPYPVYSTELPYPARTPERPYPPGPTQPLHPWYTTRSNGRVPSEGHPGTARYPSEGISGTPPPCCRSKTQQRQCCSKTRSPSTPCCRPAAPLPRCCFTVYFNVTCCRSHMQQQQQQQPSRVANPQIQTGSVSDTPVRQQRHVVNPVEVKPLAEEELRPNGGHHPSHTQLPSNGDSSNRNSHNRAVALTCCRLSGKEAVDCCRDGYQETGNLPLCCISSPDQSPDGKKDILSENEELQRDAAYDPQQAAPHHQNHSGHGMEHRSRHGEKGKSLEKCNGMPYNVDEHICCDNTLRQRLGVKPACCNNVAYDSFLYKCCNGKIRISCNANYKPKKSLWGVLI